MIFLKHVHLPGILRTKTKSILFSGSNCLTTLTLNTGTGGFGCSTQMVLKERQTSPDRFVWECPADNCRKRRSVRAGSFFEASKIPLAQWLYNVFLWSIGKSNQRHSLLTELSLRTIVTLLDKICNICSMKILNGNFTLGGRGKAVEIDKSMFGNKRKYNRGRVSEGQ